MTSSGVRGVYLNELDRTGAIQWGAAFASRLWDQQPRIGRTTPGPGIAISKPALDGDSGDLPTVDDETSIGLKLATARRGPVVVIGFDERPSSPDIVVGVALGLRRMGCHVIDLGQASQPGFHFAVHHLQADGGVFVTGTGCDPAWTGFHFAGRDSVPWLRFDVLSQLEARATSSVRRPTRTAGVQRPFHIAEAYQAGMWKLFHALRPLKVVCGTATRQLPRLLDNLFARLPCQLSHESMPVRHRDLGDPSDPDIRRISGATVSGAHDVGVIIDDDGERCAFVTDRGDLVTVADLARLLVLFELHERRSVRMVVDETLTGSAMDWLNSIDAPSQVERTSSADVPARLAQFVGGIGFTADHRFWFGEDYPACDAIMTLAHVLQALSLSDAPMSQVLQRAC